MPNCDFRKVKSDLPCGKATFLADYVKVKGGWALATLCADHNPGMRRPKRKQEEADNA